MPLLIFSAPLILAALYGALDFVAAQQIFDQVNQLRTPVEIQHALSLLPNGTYKPHLESAWVNAKQAKDFAVKMQEKTRDFYFSMVFEQTIKGWLFDLGLQTNASGNYKSAKNSFFKAQTEAAIAFNELLVQLEGRRIELDEMGADNSRYSGLANVKYKEAEDFLNQANEYYNVTNTMTGVRCSQVDLLTCLIATRKNQKTIEHSITIFNTIAAPDKSLYLNMTKLLVELEQGKQQMQDKYSTLRSLAQAKQKSAESIIETLENEDIKLVTENVINVIPAKATHVVLQKTGSPDTMHKRLKSDIRDAEITAEEIEIQRKLKRDDYLFNAITSAKPLYENSLITEQLAKTLESDLEAHEKDMQDYIDGLMRSMDVNNPFHIEARELLEKAIDQDKVGRKLVLQAQAAKKFTMPKDEVILAKINDETSDEIQWLIRIIGHWGIYIKDLQDRLRNALTEKNESTKNDIIGDIIDDAMFRALPLIRELDEMEARSADLIGFAELVKENPELSQYIDPEMLDELKRDFDLASGMKFPEDYERMKEIYDKIISKLEPIAEEISSSILTKSTRAFADIGIVECNEQVNTKLRFHITNPTRIKLINAKIEVDTKGLVERTSNGFDNIVFSIPEIAPLSIIEKELDAVFTAARCTTTERATVSATPSKVVWEEQVQLEWLVKPVAVIVKNDVLDLIYSKPYGSLVGGKILLLNPGENITLRYAQKSNVDVQRRVSIKKKPNFQDRIDVSIGVTNLGEKLSNFELTEELPAGAEVIEYSMQPQVTITGLQFTLPSLAPAETVSITYAYLVNNTAGFVESKKGEIGSLVGLINMTNENFSQTPLFRQYEQLINLADEEFLESLPEVRAGLEQQYEFTLTSQRNSTGLPRLDFDKAPQNAEVKNRLERICQYSSCVEVKNACQEKDTCPELETAEESVLAEFQEFDTSALERKLDEFEKAFDGDAEMTNSVTEAKTRLSSLKAAITKMDFSSFDNFAKKTDAQKARVIKEEFSDMLNYLELRIASIQGQARSEMIKAKQRFDEIKASNGLELLGNAKEYFDTGYFYRAMDAARQIGSGTGNESQNPIKPEYVLPVLGLVGAGVYAMKKPKEKPRKQFKMLSDD